MSALAERLEHWRRTRPRGQWISAELWDAATSLARVHGICPVSSALKLNYYDLQPRLGLRQDQTPALNSRGNAIHTPLHVSASFMPTVWDFR